MYRCCNYNVVAMIMSFMNDSYKSFGFFTRLVRIGSSMTHHPTTHTFLKQTNFRCIPLTGNR